MDLGSIALIVGILLIVLAFVLNWLFTRLGIGSDIARKLTGLLLVLAGVALISVSIGGSYILHQP